MTSLFETIKLRLTFLTPLHISAGKELTPIEYTLWNDAIYLIQFEHFLSKNLNPEWQDKIITWLDEGNLIQIRKTIHQLKVMDKLLRNPPHYIKGPIAITYDFKQAFEENLDNERSNMIIEPMIRDNNGRPYIPGSSLKGAFKTAILNELSQGDFRGNSIKYPEAVLGGSFDTDPFSAIKFRDIPLQNGDTVVGKCVLSHIDPQRNQVGKINIFREVVMGECIQKGKWTVDTEILIDKKRLAALNKRNRLPEFNKSFFIRALRNHYTNRLESELKRFYNSNSELIDDFINERDSLQENESLIRVGRHSQYEFVTTKNRLEKSPGKSRTKFEGEYPFGWVKFAFL